MIVQRLTSIPRGKSMKYERIGAQEFVPYPYEELDLENIKKACYKHFKDRLLDFQMETDILASQNGPSCNKLSHIKNFKLVYVRFVTKNRQSAASSASEFESMSVLQTLKLPPSKQNITKSLQNPAYPKSLSVSSMLKLGSAIPLKASKPDNVDLISFNIEKMGWDYPQQKKLFIEKEPFRRRRFPSCVQSKRF